MARTRFVFLDRDGTLNRDTGYVHKLEDYELLPGVVTALSQLAGAGYHFAIVTNQSGIARELYTISDFDRFHTHLLADLGRAGIRVEETFLCPHLPNSSCDCRKPSPASLFRARDRFDIDLGHSWMIGDHLSDVECGRRAGCETILLLTGHGVEESRKLPPESTQLVLPSLREAAEHILLRAEVLSSD